MEAQRRVYYNFANPAVVAARLSSQEPGVVKNVRDVLREKELDLMRVRREVETLRRLASELTEPEPVTSPPRTSAPELRRRNRWPLSIDSESPAG